MLDIEIYFGVNMYIVEIFFFYLVFLTFRVNKYIGLIVIG